MYQYKDKSYRPQIGDVVTWTNLSANCTFAVANKPYLITGVPEDQTNSVFFTSEQGDTKRLGPVGRRTLAHKPGAEAKTGDACVVIKDHFAKNGPKIGTTFTATSVSGSTVITDIPAPGADTYGFYGFEKILVLVKKELELSITDHIIDIKGSSLADRLRLRQVLLDNGQELYDETHSDLLKKLIDTDNKSYLMGNLLGKSGIHHITMNQQSQ